MKNQMNPQRGKMNPEQLRKFPFDRMVPHEEMNQMPGAEDVSRRTRASKVFSLGRNLYQAVLYPETVHAQAKDGTLVEIDNTLETRKDDRGLLLCNRQNPEMKTTFRPASDREMVRLENEQGQSIAWRAEKAQQVVPTILPNDPPKHPKDDLRRDVLDRLNAAVMYENILPGISLRCRLNSVAFKDEWILTRQAASGTLSLLLFMPGLTPCLQEDNSIQCVAEDGSTPFSLPAPFVQDANEEKGPVSVCLEPCADTKELWRVTYALDEAWLQTAAFPVVLDPAVVTKKHASAIEDNFVTSKKPNAVQNHAATAMTVSKGSTNWGTSRSFVKFLSTGLPPIDSSYYVTKAMFNIKTKAAPSHPASILLKEALADWSSQSITYNNAPALNQNALDYVYMTAASTWYTYDISNLVRQWYSGTNYGFALESQNNTYLQFCTSDDAYNKPYVVIDYVSLAGLEGYLAYEQQDVGRAGTGYVSLYNGNLIFAHEDTVCNGNLMPVSTAHYYNSCYHGVDPFSLGYGWKLNLQQSLHKETLTDANNNSVTYYVYMDSDGTRHHFKKIGGKWKDLSGLSMELTISGSTASITDKSDTVLLFDLPTVEFNNNYANVKMLKSITDARGNAMTVSTAPSRAFVSATDGAGRNTQATTSTRTDDLWGPEGSSKKLIFVYNAAGNLIKIKHQDNAETTYAYNTNHLLTSVVNLDGYKVTYTYTAAEPYRVKRVEFSNGNTKYGGRKYEYKDCLTVVTDLVPNAAGTALSEGKSLFYHFNDYGNVVSVNDQLGYAAFSKYTDELPVNHPEVVSKLQRTVVNLLKGHHLEAAGSWTNENLGGTGTYSYATDAFYMGKSPSRWQKPTLPAG